MNTDQQMRELEELLGQIHGKTGEVLRTMVGTLDALIKEVKRLRAATIHAQVSKFHKAFGQDIADKPAVPSDDAVRLRMRLIAEEFVEAMEAVFGANANVDDMRAHIRGVVDGLDVKPDLVELADAFADLDYVVEGARLVFGIDGAPIAAEVHRSNMAKLGPDGKPIVREDGKRLKPPGWTPPDIAAELRKQGWEG